MKGRPLHDCKKTAQNRRGAAAFRHAALHGGLRHLIRRSGKLQNRADGSPNACAIRRTDRSADCCADRGAHAGGHRRARALTEAALLADIDEAASFFCDWFYDRSAVIDPAYSDYTEYPPFRENGAPMVYPTAVADIPDRTALLAATERYFEHDTAEALLSDVFAQDVDGYLCVSKSEGLGGPGYYVSLTVTGSGDGSYTIRMDSGIPHTDYGFDPIYVQYTPGSETAVFGGDHNVIQSFFITHLYTVERTITIE